MAKRHHAWTAALHPRDKRGEFARSSGGGDKAAAKAARKAGGAVANDEQRKIRNKAYRRAGFRTASGAVSGALYVGVGHYTGNKKYTAAGIGRIGLAAAEGHTNFSNAKRLTSKDFHKLGEAAKSAEETKRLRRSNAYSLGSTVADSIIANRAGKAVGREVIRRKINTMSNNDWNYSVNHDTSSNPFKRAQGPAPWNAKSAGTSRVKGNKGVYNISSGTIGKPGRGAFGRARPVGTGKTRAQRAGAKFTSARNSARSTAWKARGGSTAVATTRGNNASKAVVLASQGRQSTSQKVTRAAARTGRMGDFSSVRAAQSLGLKASPRPFKRR
jgi:hypothetical protein